MGILLDKRILSALAGVCLLFALGSVAMRQHNAALAVARAELVAAQREAAQADSRAALARQAGIALARVAYEHEAASRAAEARADSASRLLIEARTRFRLTADSAPDTCLTIIQSAEVALAASDSVAAGLRASLEEARQSGIALGVALDTTQTALAALRASVADLGAAAGAVADASRPSFLTRLKPRLGLGVGIGVDAQGVVRPTLGITYGITF